jgi:regulatory protein YycI of two-component signal transduction system YycFG
MDWAKAKTIFIIVFLLLNIFLFGTILYTNSDLRFQSDYTRYAKQYLESRNITIESRIKNRTGEVGNLIYIAKRFNFNQLTRLVFGHDVSPVKENETVVYQEQDEKIMSMADTLYIRDKLSDGIDIFQDSKAFSNKVYKILNEAGYSRANLQLEAQGESKDAKWMNFILKFKNGLLFDQVITVSIDNEGFITLTLPAREVTGISDYKEEILSAYQVLVMGNLPEGSHIKSVDFGYIQASEGELYDSPVWRILFINGETSFFNAYTGEKLQENWS